MKQSQTLLPPRHSLQDLPQLSPCPSLSLLPATSTALPLLPLSDGSTTTRGRRGRKGSFTEKLESIESRSNIAVRGLNDDVDGVFGWAGGRGREQIRGGEEGGEGFGQGRWRDGVEAGGERGVEQKVTGA
jgi:hypothetical protein